MNKVVIAGEAPASPFLLDHDDVLCASRFNAFGVVERMTVKRIKRIKRMERIETDFDLPWARLYPPQAE